MIRKKIVIVDGSASIAAALKELIEKRTDCEVAGTAYDGVSGTDLILSARPDLALLDLILPLRDGFSVMRRVRRVFPECAFFIVSGLMHENIIAKALDSGAAYYMTKPFDADELVERIGDVCGLRGADKRDEAETAPSAWEAEVDKKLYKFYVQLGLPVNQNGFVFVREAVLLSLREPQALTNLKGTLYPRVGAVCGTSGSVVERGIRKAIETAWSRGRPECFGKLFDSDIFANEKPTNGEFLRLLTDSILLENPKPRRRK